MKCFFVDYEGTLSESPKGTGDVIFIDDKQKHLDLAIQEGYNCLNVDEI